MALECNRNDILECLIYSMRSLYDFINSEDCNLRWIRLTILKYAYQLMILLEIIKIHKMYVRVIVLVCLKPKRMVMVK